MYIYNILRCCGYAKLNSIKCHHQKYINYGAGSWRQVCFISFSYIIIIISLAVTLFISPGLLSLSIKLVVTAHGPPDRITRSDYFFLCILSLALYSRGRLPHSLYTLGLSRHKSLPTNILPKFALAYPYHYFYCSEY
jgi:hypothetical protein